MRIGLIGCGWIAETHLANLSALGEQVTCVCDPDPERRAWAAGLTGAEAFADAEALLENGEPEAVLVLTPPRIHREITVEALERGLPVYLEKPVARDLADAKEIVATVERTGVVCAIGYQWRAITWVPQVRDLFAERALGLLAVRMFGATAGRTWFTDQAAGGGQVLERASHGIDLVQAIAGPAVRVSATGVNVPLAGGDRPSTSEIDDVLALTLELERGAVATVQVVWQRDDLPRTYALDVIGDGARIEGCWIRSSAPEASPTGRPSTCRTTAHRAHMASSASSRPRARARALRLPARRHRRRRHWRRRWPVSRR